MPRRNKPFHTMDTIRILISMTALVAVFFVSSSAERNAQRRDEAQRESIKTQIDQVYKVLQLAISRTESCAVETDDQGNVLWMNHLAAVTLNLRLGENVTSCMPESGRSKHETAFQSSMRQADGTQPQQGSIKSHHPLLKVQCVALGKDLRELPMSIEAWRTPNGAMVFLTPLQTTETSTALTVK